MVSLQGLLFSAVPDNVNEHHFDSSAPSGVPFHPFIFKEMKSKPLQKKRQDLLSERTLWQ